MTHVTTMRLGRDLERKLELIRSATERTVGRRVSLTEIVRAFLRGDVQDFEANNPGCFDTEAVDVSSLWLDPK